MKRNKSGFTLIELLAVILILGIIALIAIPTVNKVLEESRIEALKVTIQNLNDAVTSNCEINLLKNNNHNDLYIIQNGKVFPSIRIDGKLPTDGIIKVDSKCNASITSYNGTYCTTTNNNKTEIEKSTSAECTLIESTSPSYFTFENGVITDYSIDGPKDVVIPSVINNQKVLEIGSKAFTSKSLTTVIFPNTITKIGDGAFLDNNLVNIKLPNSITYLETASFARNELKNVVIPNSVKIIKGGAFVNNNITEYIGAFTDNELTDLEIPNSVVELGHSAFSFNKLENVILPSSLETIRDNAFFNNSLTKIKLPSNIISIGNKAFNKNRLDESDAFVYARNNDGSVNNKIIVSYGGIKKNNIIIPDSVITINPYAFESNSIESIIFPENLKDIGTSSFRHNNIKNIIIPASVTSVGNNAFSNNNITTINMPGRDSNDLGTNWYDGTPTFNFN